MCLGTSDHLLVDGCTDATTRPMTACPRFNNCNANLCPLDPDWKARSHLKNEAVCPCVRQRAKGTYDGSIGRGEVVVKLDAILNSRANIAKRAIRTMS